MPHQRHRYLLPHIKKALSWSPSICILGMRQTGKTTLLKALAREYLTLDDDSLRLKFEAGEWSQLEAASTPTGIDECQKTPGVFDRVKLICDRRKRPGQFLLTGSVRFLSKKQIKESLTGRTAVYELLPMNISESHSESLSSFLTTLRNHGGEVLLSRLLEARRFRRAQVESFARTGGLPGICFRRDRAIRARLHENHLETILSRDLNMIVPTRLSFKKLRDILRDVFTNSGEPVNRSALARRAGVSQPTLDRILRGFESLFLIRPHGTSLYPLEAGLAAHVAERFSVANQTTLLQLVHLELLTQLKYGTNFNFEFDEVRHRNGVYIPFRVTFSGHDPLLITLDADTAASEKSLRSLTWQKKRQPLSRGIALHLGDKAYLSSAGHPCVPVDWIF